MSPRTYRLGKREAAMEDTRRRIIAAARALIVEAGFHRSSLEEIARRASVTRRTVYHQFDSKLGLLAAVVRDALARAGLPRVLAALQDADPRAALERSIAEGARLWAADRALFRMVIGLATVDPQAQAVVSGREQERRAAMAQLAARLADVGALHPTVSRERAATVLAMLTSFAAYDALAEDAQPPDQVASLLQAMAASILVERDRPATVTPDTAFDGFV